MSHPPAPLMHWEENRALRQFLIGSTAMLLWIAVDLLLPCLPTAYQPVSVSGQMRWRLLTAYLLPAFGLTTILLMWRLLRQAEPAEPGRVGWLGLAFLAGGAIFDVGVTLVCSPDLVFEGNPYVRILLDTQHSLPFVYLHLLITQAGFVTLFCCVWLAFLRHQQILQGSIIDARPRGWAEFLKAATGGAHLNWRQWLLPVRPSEVPFFYHSMWLTTVSVVFGITVFRWYAGLEWLTMPDPSLPLRFTVAASGLALALICYLGGLWFVTRRELMPVAAANKEP